MPVRRADAARGAEEHIHTLPEQPDWIPYRTSYYPKRGDSAIAHGSSEALEEGEYEVRIDSSLEPGQPHLRGVLPARRDRGRGPHLVSLLPSVARQRQPVGIALATRLAEHLRAALAQYSYRFLFIPGTIGSITWLAATRTGVGRIRHGLVVACVGDAGPPTYKRSRRGDAAIDRAAAHVLQALGPAPDRRLLPLRLRRAPVLLSRLRPARGLV